MAHNAVSNIQHDPVYGPVIVTLVQIAAYGRMPVWEAWFERWPALAVVRFRANDRGDGSLERRAIELLRPEADETSLARG